MKAKTNSGSFDDSRGLGSDTSTVRFSSPISINEIVFAARREPVAKHVIVDVAYDVMAKGFKVQEESENPRPEWTRQVSKVLDELDTKDRFREPLFLSGCMVGLPLGSLMLIMVMIQASLCRIQKRSFH